MSRFEGTVDWLGPLRTSVPRRVQPVENATILHDGQGTTELLSDPRQSGLLMWVQTQLRELSGHDVEPQPDGHEVRLVARFADGKLAPLADVGSGVSQVLPALAHLARVATGAADGRIVAIEQPEAHLHADAEAALGRAITEALGGTRERPAVRRARMIIETHSENILLALQLAVLQRRLPRDDFVAYWVSRRPDGSAWIERITFDEQARPDPDWPSGVFSETTDLARQVLNARRRSQR